MQFARAVWSTDNHLHHYPFTVWLKCVYSLMVKQFGPLGSYAKILFIWCCCREMTVSCLQHSFTGAVLFWSGSSPVTNMGDLDYSEQIISLWMCRIFTDMVFGKVLKGFAKNIPSSSLLSSPAPVNTSLLIYFKVDALWQR